MASGGFPQLPTTVWRGVWQLLNKAPTRRIDERTLSADLGVQSTAAKQYLKELEKLGIINPDGQPSELADDWRQDANDPDIVGRILELAYPESLRQLAPPNDLDREKVIRWFQGEKLGIGAAKNKAATYLMVASGMPDEGSKVVTSSNPRKPKEREKSIPKPVEKSTKPLQVKKEEASARKPQLAVNVQIHISADASTDQIDAIFSAMKRYFDDAETD